MNKKPRIYLKGGVWDWTPDLTGQCDKGSKNYEACLWCMNRNRKEGR